MSGERGMDALVAHESQKVAVSEAYWKGRKDGAAWLRARVMAELEVASSYRLSERILTALLSEDEDPA